jgi:NTE family protein
MAVLPLGFGISAFYFLPRDREAHGSIVVHHVHDPIDEPECSALFWNGRNASCIRGAERNACRGAVRGELMLDDEARPVRIGLVLSAGGLRGAAHVGVIRQLVRHGIPIHAMVGVSAGAVVAAYYAGVGLDLDELVADAAAFRGRHLLTHGLNVQLGYRFDARLGRWCGVIPDRLRRLETARFDRLHHGVQRLGIVCHDLKTGTPYYFSTGSDRDLTLGDVVRASASIPRLFPAISVQSGQERLELTDGGVSDPVPVAFARSPAIGATHVIVSDCRWLGRIPATDATTAWIRPRMMKTGTLWSPRRGLVSAVRGGEDAVTDAILHRIRSWTAP